MKQKKKELMYQEYGKYFLNLSKLIFGGVTLVGIQDQKVNLLFYGVGLLSFGFHVNSGHVLLLDSMV